MISKQKTRVCSQKYSNFNADCIDVMNEKYEQHEMEKRLDSFEGES